MLPVVCLMYGGIYLIAKPILLSDEKLGSEANP